jgi:hypothetical protein
MIQALPLSRWHYTCLKLTPVHLWQGAEKLTGTLRERSEPSEERGEH